MIYKTHRYMGVTITPCEAAKGQHAGRWVLVSYEHGLRVFDQQLRHCQTLAEARELIRAETRWATN